MTDPKDTKLPVLYRSLQGHNDAIESICFNSNSQQMATVSGDSLLYLWNLQANNIQAKKLKGHSAAITEVAQFNQVAFSPSGQLIATASMDHTIRIWNNNSVENYPSTVIRSHGACVKTVSFSPDSRFFVSGSDDKTVKIFNVNSVNQSATKKFVKSFVGHNNWVSTARFNPTGRLIATGGTDRMVNLWDVESSQRIYNFQDHEGNINAVRFLPESHCTINLPRFGQLF